MVILLKQNFLKEKLRTGRPVLGTWSIVPSANLVEIIASAGIDFLIIDSEHGPINFETAQIMAIACESRGVSPVMRVGGVIEPDILKALDIGVHCVQIPNISTARDVAASVSFAKYPPIGNRGFSPFTRAGNYSLDQARSLTQSANSDVLIAIHVEGQAGIDNIDEILREKNIDIIFVGIFDISKSLGIPGDVTNPKVVKILRELTEKISAAGKYPGTIANTSEQMRDFVSFGMKYITYSVDCEVISRRYREISSDFKACVIGK